MEWTLPVTFALGPSSHELNRDNCARLCLFRHQEDDVLYVRTHYRSCANLSSVFHGSFEIVSLARRVHPLLTAVSPTKLMPRGGISTKKRKDGRTGGYPEEFLALSRFSPGKGLP